MLEIFKDWRQPLSDEDEAEEETKMETEPEPPAAPGAAKSEDSPPHQFAGQIIGFMSGKGGVGKTGLAINVANFCAENGAKVLLVDCDLNTNGATTFFGIQKDISDYPHRQPNILTMHDMLTAVMDDGNLSGSNIITTASPITIKPNYDFIPASIVGGRFHKQGLTKESLTKLEDSFFSTWRKEYDLILLDFCAGAGSLNFLLSQLPDKVCIVMPPNDIARQAVRRQLGFLFRECNLDNLICCINMLSSRGHSVNEGALFHEFPGFKNSAEYARLYDTGKMIDMTETYQCSSLYEIVKNIYSDNSVLESYDEKAQMMLGEDYESEWDARERAEKRQLRRLLIVILLFSFLLCISFSVILVLRAWDKIPVWGYIVFGVGIAAFGACVLAAIHKLNP